MIFEHCKWHFHTNWEKLEKYRADVFQIYPNAIRFNLLEFCPSMPLFGLSVFLLSSSTVLSRYCYISVNFMTSWSVPKLPKIAWHSPYGSKRTGPKIEKKKFQIPIRSGSSGWRAALWKCYCKFTLLLLLLYCHAFFTWTSGSDIEGSVILPFDINKLND